MQLVFPMLHLISIDMLLFLRPDIGAELNFKFIDNESDEEDREHSLSYRNRRDDKLSKSIERIAGKFRGNVHNAWRFITC